MLTSLAVRCRLTAADWTMTAVELTPDSTHFPAARKTDQVPLLHPVRASLQALSKSSKKPSTSDKVSALQHMDFEIFLFLNLGERVTAQLRAVRVGGEVGERHQQKLDRPPASNERWIGPPEASTGAICPGPSQKLPPLSPLPRPRVNRSRKLLWSPLLHVAESPCSAKS